MPQNPAQMLSWQQIDFLTPDGPLGSTAPSVNTHVTSCFDVDTDSRVLCWVSVLTLGSSDLRPEADFPQELDARRYSSFIRRRGSCSKPAIQRFDNLESIGVFGKPSNPGPCFFALMWLEELTTFENCCMKQLTSQQQPLSHLLLQQDQGNQVRRCPKARLLGLARSWQPMLPLAPWKQNRLRIPEAELSFHGNVHAALFIIILLPPPPAPGSPLAPSGKCTSFWPRRGQAPSARHTTAPAMGLPCWRRVPWVSLSCLCLCLLPHVVLGTTEETSTPGRENTALIPSAGSVTATLAGQSTATSLRTSNQEISASSQNHQTHGMETSREAQTTTLTQMSTSPLSSPPSVHNVTETSPPEEVTTSFPSSVSNTLIVKSKTVTVTTLTESTCNITEETSAPGTRSPTPVPSAASITAEPEGQSAAASSRTSIWDTSASSQNYQTQSTETTRESQTSILTQMITSAPSFSPSAHNVTGTVSQDTSPPGETATSSLSSVTNIPMMISKTITMTTFTNSTLGNTAETSSAPVTGSLMPVTSVASMTAEPEGESPATFSGTSTQHTAAFPQNQQTHGMGTTGVSQINTLTLVASTVLSSPSGLNLSGTVSQETLPSGGTTTSSPSSDSSTFPAASEVSGTPASTESALGNTEETSLSVSGSISAITSKVSTVWWSDALSTALSPTSLPPELSTALHTHLSEGAETTGRPHESSSVSPSASQETFTPREATWTSSLSSEGSTTWLPKELPSTPPSAATVLVTGSPATWTAGTIPRVPSEVSTTGEPGQPATRPSHSTTLPETTGAGAQTQWTQETGTTGEVRVHSPRYGVTQMTEAATSPSSSPMLDGHTQQITMAPSTYRSTIHPVSTSPQRSSAVSQSGHTPASKTTRESQTTRSISPVTDGFQTATTPASSFTASQHPPSEMAPQDASTISAATTFTPAPTRDGHTTQARTTALQAAPSSPDATLGPSGRTSPSITGAIPPATSVVSTPVGAEGRWTAASASASPNTAPAMTQTHQARGTEASGGTQTSQPASSGSGTIAAGSATPSSSRTSGTTPSGSHGMSTSGETTWFSPRPSRDTHTPQSTSGLPSPSASHGVTPESTGTGSPSASPDATPASTGTGSPSASPDVTPASTGTGSPSASPDCRPGKHGNGVPLGQS
nr:mucin-4-like [Saimiri boliviensis boliviensis]